MNREDIFKYNEPLKKEIDKEFIFSVIGLAHGHIYGMVQGLLNEGENVKIKYVFDEDKTLVENFLNKYPQAKYEEDIDKIISDSETKLIVSAAIPSERADIGIKSMLNGKDYFVDKAPMISLKQLEEVKKVCEKTGRKYIVYYCESIDNDSAIYARDLIKRNVIGKVFSVFGAAPHRLNIESRPIGFLTRLIPEELLPILYATRFISSLIL